MAQGPFRGHAGALSRVFGGLVTVTPVGGQPRDIRAIFRSNAQSFEIEGDVRVEHTIPILRARQDLVADLVEGSLVDPKTDQIYRVSYHDTDTARSPIALAGLHLWERNSHAKTKSALDLASAYFQSTKEAKNALSGLPTNPDDALIELCRLAPKRTRCSDP